MVSHDSICQGACQHPMNTQKPYLSPKLLVSSDEKQITTVFKTSLFFLGVYEITLSACRVLNVHDALSPSGQFREQNMWEIVGAQPLPQKHWYRCRFWQHQLVPRKVTFNHDPPHIVLSCVTDSDWTDTLKVLSPENRILNSFSIT